MRRAVFLDRDGTIMEEVGYCSDPAQVQVYEGAREAIQRLRDAGFLIVVVTNQSGIGHGYITEPQYHAVHAEMIRQLHPVTIDAVYYSAETPENPSPRRKPNPGMVLEAASELDIDLSKSYFVGDRAGDVECGRNAQTRTVLLDTGYGLQTSECSPDYRAKDLVEAVDWILRDSQ
jgi:D-glycero-D-manno-heptose 1,7-bisphosphate phosphatase